MRRLPSSAEKLSRRPADPVARQNIRYRERERERDFVRFCVCVKEKRELHQILFKHSKTISICLGSLLSDAPHDPRTARVQVGCRPQVLTEPALVPLGPAPVPLGPAIVRASVWILMRWRPGRLQCGLTWRIFRKNTGNNPVIMMLIEKLSLCKH